MSKFKFTHLVAGLGAAFLLGGPACATIVGGAITLAIDNGINVTATAAFVKLSVPLTGSTPANTVGQDNFGSKNLFGFDESQNILLGAPLVMDQGGPVAAGTQVASHYVFFDPAVSGRVVGTVDFDSDILGIMTSTGLLAASDFLVNTGVNYLNPGLRGLEPGDTVSFSGRTISLDFSAGSPGDYIRVITAFSPGAVPEPGSLALVGLALAGAGLARRRCG